MEHENLVTGAASAFCSMLPTVPVDKKKSSTHISPTLQRSYDLFNIKDNAQWIVHHKQAQLLL